MKRLSTVFILVFLFSATNHALESSQGTGPFEKILKTHWNEKEYRFDHASSEMKTSYLNLKDYTDSEVVAGTAFGAKASVIIQANLQNIEEYYSNEKAINSLGET